MTEREKIIPGMELCVAALTEARYKLPAADRYDIHTGKGCYFTAVNIQRDWSSAARDNPFFPVINVIYDDALGRWEWYVIAIRNGEGEVGSIGSEGY